MEVILARNPQVDSDRKIDSKQEGLSKNKRKGPAALWTSTKQSMSYVTVRGIESDTSWQECDWPKEGEKELISNAYDWLNDYYPDGTKETRKIAVCVKIESILDKDSLDGDKSRVILRIAVRNSNVDNIPVFENLKLVFDYTQFHSTKRNQHRMVSGALGDYLKRSLGMGYACWTNNYNRELSLLADKQWPEPIILRYNGQERRVFIHVNWDNQAYWPVFSEPTRYDAATNFTEVQVTLPIDSILSRNWDNSVEWVLGELKGYFKRNRIGKLNTDFSFSVVEKEGLDY